MWGFRFSSFVLLLDEIEYIDMEIMIKMIVIILLLYITRLVNCRRNQGEWGGLYGLLDKTQTDCEVQSLTVGSLLADRYNSLDEETEWDQRLHTGKKSKIYFILIF